MKVLLLFPPNWSACVSGPHLALPLIAGGLKKNDILVETWDLTEEFYRLYGCQPNNKEINLACDFNDIAKLNDLYFNWEDSISILANKQKHHFGLLSGFTGGIFNTYDIYELIKVFNDETVFTTYYESVLKPKIENYEPTIIGISISSFQQIFSTVELALRIKHWLPNCKIVLGGNILTRLVNTRSFLQLKNLVDKIIIYQGEFSMMDYCMKVLENVQDKKILSEENIPYTKWPVPSFDGLNYGKYPGGVNTISYASTRGCYYGRCSFCAIPAGWSKIGYAGSADGHFTVNQIKQIIDNTGINKIKFVDEAFPPAKVSELFYASVEGKIEFFWEAYVRLERKWENPELLKKAFDSGCRRLYFGLEISPDANRKPLNKNDRGNILKIMESCKDLGILIHLFCMVGHPKTSVRDAELTVNFLIDNQDLVDTADLVGFRLDRGINVEGVKRSNDFSPDYAMNYTYEATSKDSLSYIEVQKLELVCQEALWENVPRLLHPLYRIGKSWKNTKYNQQENFNKSYPAKVA